MDNVISQESVVTADQEQVFGQLPDGDVVILSLKNGVYYGLNAVAARIWALIQKPMTFREVHEALLVEYDVEPDQCAHELQRLLRDLAENSLIQIMPVNTPVYKGSK